MYWVLGVLLILEYMLFFPVCDIDALLCIV